MSDLKKIIKANIESLFTEEKYFGDMESAFGVDKELSVKEKEQFDDMEETGVEKNGPLMKKDKQNGEKEVEKASKQTGKDAVAYYKETAKKMKKFQTPSEKDQKPSQIGEGLTDAPKVDREEASDDVDAYEVEALGAGKMSGLKYDDEDSEQYKAFEDRNDAEMEGDTTYEKIKKNGKKYKDYKYDKPDEYHNSPKVRVKESVISEAINEDIKGFLTSKVVPKIQEAGLQFLPFINGQIQRDAVDQVKGFEDGAAISYDTPKGVELVRIIVNMSKKDVLNKDMGVWKVRLYTVRKEETTNENKKTKKMEYTDVIEENIFKANGKLISEEQVLKIANKVPSRVKIDESVFAITDGDNYYRLMWEGDEPVITHSKNTEVVSESISKMKAMWEYDTKASYSTKNNITESADDAFKRMFKQMRETEGLVGEKTLNESVDLRNISQDGKFKEGVFLVPSMSYNDEERIKDARLKPMKIEKEEGNRDQLHLVDSKGNEKVYGIDDGIVADLITYEEALEKNK